MLSSDGRLIASVFGSRPAHPTLSYQLEGIPPWRPTRDLETGGHGAAHPDRFQHTYGDRVFGACLEMSGKPLKHAAISLRLAEAYDGPLVATYKVVQDTLDARAKVIARDDNSLRVPEFHVSRDLPLDDANIVTAFDLRTEQLYSREFIARAQPYRVATDGRHSFTFTGDAARNPSEYLSVCIENAKRMQSVGAAHLPAGLIPDHMLKGASITIVVRGLDPKRDLDNCVLAVMDVIQAARDDCLADCVSIDRLVRQVHAYTVAGAPAIESDILTLDNRT